MGIPYYFTYLIKNHGAIIQPINNLTNNINYLYLDCNSIIYDAIDFSKYINDELFEKELIQNTINKIINIIEIIKPCDIIFISFDGIPPFAKMHQQKIRRYKSFIYNKLLNKNYPWNLASITPGTPFMIKLNESIYKYFENYVFNYWKNDYYSQIILNLSDVEGEGEHKIFDHIRSNKNNLEKHTVIYGMDSDLIMLSLNHLSYCNNIYLYRETPLFIESLNSELNNNEDYLLNINLLGNQIYKELINDSSIQIDTPLWLTNAANELELTFNDININNNKFYNKICDYIFICFLLGNDFMPHFPALNIRYNGFNKILDLYKTCVGENKFLIKNNNINLPLFKEFIKKLAQCEEMYIKEYYIIKNKITKKTNYNSSEESRLNNIPMCERNLENFINIYEKEWEYRYYYSLFSIQNNNNYDKNISYIVDNYMQMLLWCYKYYTNGCNNWTLYYKYNYPPLLCDLYKYMPYFSSELEISNNSNKVDYNMLLSYVLPFNSLNLLPEKIKNHLLTNFKDYYRDDYNIVYAFCKYYYEAHVEFNEININNLFQSIKMLI
jgi:5'-3' exonuclease